MALLFATLLVTPAVSQMVQGFVKIADAGKSTNEQIASICLAMARQLSAGVLAFMVVLTSAGAAQLLARLRAPSTSTAEGTSWFPRGRGGWILVLSSLLVIPVGALIYTTEGIARLVMLIGDPARPDKEAITQAIEGVTMQQMAGVLATRLMRSFWSAVALSAILLAFGIANILVIRARKAPEPLSTYSWCAFAVACLGGGWALFRLSADARLFAAAAR
jgi:hypothetical protein